MVDHKWNSTLTARRRQLQALVRLTLAPPHLEWPALHRELGRALSRAGRALEIGPPDGTHPSGAVGGRTRNLDGVEISRPAPDERTLVDQQTVGMF